MTHFLRLPSYILAWDANVKKFVPEVPARCHSISDCFIAAKFFLQTLHVKEAVLNMEQVYSIMKQKDNAMKGTMQWLMMCSSLCVYLLY